MFLSKQLLFSHSHTYRHTSNTAIKVSLEDRLLLSIRFTFSLMNYPNQYIPQKYNTYVVQMPSQAGQTSNQGNISVLPANNGTHYQISSGYSYYTDVNNQGAMQGHYPQQVYPQSGTMNSTVPKFKQEAIPSENQVVSHNYALQAPRSSPVTGPSSGPQTNNVPIQSSQAAPIPSQKPMPINQLQSPAAPMSYPSGMAMNPAVDPQRPMQQNPGMRAQGAVNAGVPMQTRVVPQTGVSSGPMQSSGVPNVMPMNSMHPEAYSFIAPYIVFFACAGSIPRSQERSRHLTIRTSISFLTARSRRCWRAMRRCFTAVH